jgi:hypothetical protein
MGLELSDRFALFFFHLRVGARLSLRVLAPVLAAVLFLTYVLRPEFAVELARILFLEGSPFESGLIGTALLLGLARIVAPRIRAGNGGWARSLPVAAGAQRLSAVLAMLLAEAPLLAVLVVMAWIVTAPDPVRIAIRVAGLVIGAAAAGLACLPASRSLFAKPLQVAACFLSFSGHASLQGGAVIILVLSVSVRAGTPALKKRRGPRRNLPFRAFFPALSLRSVRGRIISAYLAPAVVLGAERLFAMNNELEGKTAFVLCLWGLALGLTGVIGTAANVLAARRPAWPWARSLPRSAAARVRDDALFLAIFALPVLGGLGLLGRQFWEAAFLFGPLAWLSVRGAGAMRTAVDRPFGVIGQVAIEGTMLALILALLPWTSFLVAAATPAAFLIARNAERRFKPTRWAERHHSSAGDSLSWSAS